MDIFDILKLIGGLCLFLFGMNLMGQALERRAGGALRTVLGKLTTKKSAGFFTGLGVTAIIQSSSATTVMVVGFVNSGLMALKQAINVIMGANVGTTVTAWILSLSGIDSDNVFVQLLKPTSFTPILALIGIAFYMFAKKDKSKDTGMILLGFATLMFGMDTMSGAVAGLKDIPAFQELFLLFKNPVLGVLAGAILTAIIQSSSASVGILQALAVTGRVSYGAAIPIIMGQNIGTCVTAILSSFGANKNAKRAALVHLFFNIIGTVVWIIVFWIIKAAFAPAILDEAASLMGIAVAHSVFNVLCTALLMPMTGLLEKLAYLLVPEDKKPEHIEELDERLFATPAIALEQCHNVTANMARSAVKTFTDALDCLTSYSPELAAEVRKGEEQTDKYEDMLGSYLVKLSTHQISDHDNNEAAILLKAIGDLERISDHGVNVLESAEEMISKKSEFSSEAKAELAIMTGAVREALELTLSAFLDNDIEAINSVEALDQVIDDLKEQLRLNHITRLQQGDCTIGSGFVWSDLLTNLERASDHCSNIAGSINLDMHIHEHIRALKAGEEEFKSKVVAYKEKYAI